MVEPNLIRPYLRIIILKKDWQCSSELFDFHSQYHQKEIFSAKKIHQHLWAQPWCLSHFVLQSSLLTVHLLFQFQHCYPTISEHVFLWIRLS